MTDISRPPLEQGTALTQLWEAADDLRAAQAELTARVQDHSMVVFAYVRDIADGGEPDPAELLRSHGQIEALVQQVNDRLTAGQDALSELRFGLLPQPDADPALEARAMEHLRERFRRRASTDEGPLPEDPRPKRQEERD